MRRFLSLRRPFRVAADNSQLAASSWRLGLYEARRILQKRAWIRDVVCVMDDAASVTLLVVADTPHVELFRNKIRRILASNGYNAQEGRLEAAYDILAMPTPRRKPERVDIFMLSLAELFAWQVNRFCTMQSVVRLMGDVRQPQPPNPQP